MPRFRDSLVAKPWRLFSGIGTKRVWKRIFPLGGVLLCPRDMFDRSIKLIWKKIRRGDSSKPCLVQMPRFRDSPVAKVAMWLVENSIYRDKKSPDVRKSNRNVCVWCKRVLRLCIDDRITLWIWFLNPKQSSEVSRQTCRETSPQNNEITSKNTENRISYQWIFSSMIQSPSVPICSILDGGVWFFGGVVSTYSDLLVSWQICHETLSVRTCHDILKKFKKSCRSRGIFFIFIHTLPDGDF